MVPASGNALAAASSNVSVTLFSTFEPPASDMIKTAVPFGATSIMSSSPRNAVILLTVRVTFVTRPVRPETLITELPVLPLEA